jgi:hypothetical protein
VACVQEETSETPTPKGLQLQDHVFSNSSELPRHPVSSRYQFADDYPNEEEGAITVNELQEE